ncbi:MlaD family protein [Bacteroidota bacterium]
MRLSTEVKLGITAILSLFVIIWGVNFLKSRNIFSSKYQLLALYEQVNGLEESAFVFMHGFKIGSVSKIEFKTSDRIPFTVHIEIDKKYKLKEGSSAAIYSSDLLGTMAIKIIPSDAQSFYNPKDTIPGSVQDDLISSLLGYIKPVTQNLSGAIQTLDSTANAIKVLIQDPSIRSALDNLEQLSDELNNDLKDSGDIGLIIANLKEVTVMIKAQSAAVEQSMQNISEISADIESANLDSLINGLAETSNNLSELSHHIKSGDGTIGKLIYDDSLYDQLSILLIDLDSLINDINSNPKKYVSFSFIGK